MFRGRNVRIYVRNKARYNPETKERGFLFVDIADFAGTTIGDIKENVRRQTKNSVRIDALYLNNEPLANDRSVAHYNLEDGSILETTSNPFWVSCLYIKAAEVKQAQEGHPDDEEIQIWTQKSLPKKFTLIGLLLNSKSEYRSQPPHFAILDDFVLYLENLKKKGATMHPDYTQKDMRALEQEYNAEFVGRYPDPLAAFLDHYSMKLGYLDPDEMDKNPEPGQNQVQQVRARPEARGQGQAVQNRTGGRRRVERHCEDCEENAAEVFCVDCPGGIALCRPCSAVLHAGATRRRHTLQDIAQAPKNTKPYIPKAFLAPFAIVVAMFSAMREGKLSLTENEIKESAQSLTDTDLQDKQHGKYVGGFDCMENVLMMKGFVQKEAARVPTYALTESGQILGEKLFTFYMAFFNFSKRYQLPKVANGFRSSVLGNRQLCMLIDENERDKDRLLRFAAKKQISAQVRILPAGDYIWILTPPMMDPHEVYTGRDYANERILPFVVERKSWEDFGNSTQTNRFQRQVNSMLGSGVKNCFYLMEGSLVATKFNTTHQRQHQLKALVEKLTSEYGLYVNYTTSWMKSAQWLLWFTSLIMEGIQKGLFRDDQISYTEYMSRVARQQGAAVMQAFFRQANKQTHQWSGQLFIDYIYRDSLKERLMLTAVREDLHTNDGNKHMLIIENLQDYNKKRQSTLNKCCDAVYANPGQAREILEDKLGGFVHNLVHYDIPSYWQLSIQILLGVYVVRTETEQDRNRVKQRFLAGPQDPPPAPGVARAQKTLKEPKQPRKRPAQTVTNIDKRKTPPKQRKQSVPTSKTKSGIGYQAPFSPDEQFRRKAQIHTIESFSNPPGENDHMTPCDSLIGQIKQTGNDRVKAGSHTANPVIQPFSGLGFSLGRGSEENSAPVGREGFRNRSRNVISSGLLGGMKDVGTEFGIPSNTIPLDDGDESENVLDDSGEGMALDPADFINSQNEDEILQEVLNQSVVNAVAPSNEEHLYQLALTLSKQDTNNSADKEDDLLKAAIERSKLETSKNSKNDEDRLLKEAIEKSKMEDRLLRRKELAVDDKSSEDSSRNEEEVLKEVLQRSKLEARNKGHGQNRMLVNNTISDENTDIEDKKENVDLTDEDVMLKYAIEMSMKKEITKEENVKEEKDGILPCCGNSVQSFSTLKVEKDWTDIPQTEEEQIQMALEMSLCETPIKSNIREAPIKSDSSDTPIKSISSKIMMKSNLHENPINSNSSETPNKPSLSDTQFKSNSSETPAKSKFCDAAITCERRALDSSSNLVNMSGDTPIKTDISDNSHSAAKGVTNATRKTVKRKLETNSSLSDICAIKDKGRDYGKYRRLSKNEDQRKSLSEDLENNSDADEQLKIAFERSTVEHTPRKKSRKSHEEDLRFAIEISKINDQTEELEEDLVPPTPEKLPLSQVSSVSVKKQLTGIFSAQKVKNVSGKTGNNSFSREFKNLERSHIQNVNVVSKQSEDELNVSEVTERKHVIESKCSNIKKNSDLGIFRKILDDSSDDSDDQEEDGSVENIFADELEKDYNNYAKDLTEKDLTKCKTSTEDKCDEKLSEISSAENEPIIGFPINKVKTKNVDKSLPSQEKAYVPDIESKFVKTLDKETEGFEDIDDHDIDYQPSTQELKDVEEDEKSDESEDEFDDGETLPVILRPRSKKYRELKAKYDNLLKGMKHKNHGNNSNDTGYCENYANYKKDRDLARKLQDEMDREYRSGAYGDSDNEDELIAKRLQAFYDKRENDEMPERELILTDEEYAKQLQAELELENVAKKLQAELEQKSIAKRLQEKFKQDSVVRKLQAELEQDGVVEVPNSINDDVIDMTGDMIGGHRETFNCDVIDLEQGGGNKELLKELQRRELEKLARMKKSLETDEQFAMQMQNLERNEVVRSPNKAASQEMPNPIRYRKQVSHQKASIEQQIKQLQQYRREQMEKYNRDLDIENPVAIDTQGMATRTETIDLTHMINEPYMQTEQPVNFRNLVSPDRFPFAHTQFKSTDRHINPSQSSTGSHLTQIDHSQPSSSGHVTQTSQSQKSNITCGNCGEKGHNRKFVQCPRYHSAEETARREEMAREDKRKKEEKAVQEMILKQINAEKDEKKKQEIRNMQQIVLSAETEFQTTMNRLRNILHEVENLSEPEQAVQNGERKKPRKKNKK